MKPILQILLPTILLAGVAQADLVAHYEFSAGSELVDSTGTTGNLTAFDAGARDFTISDGFVSFPGSETNDFDYLIAPNFGLSTAAAAWTLQLEVRDPDGSGGPHPTAAGVVCSHIDAGSDSWQLNSTEIAAGAIDEGSAGVLNDGGADGAIIGDLSDGNWHTIRLVHEAGASTVTAYFDGEMVDPATLRWAAGRVTLKTMTLGTNRGENLQASVDLDNVMVWNTAEHPAAPPVPKIDSFTVTDRYVAPGSAVTLDWTIRDADSVTLSSESGPVAPTGSLMKVISQTTTFTLTASNEDGVVEESLTVHVGPERPNIILILIDDFGITDTSVPFIYDPSGNPVSYNFNNLYVTPNLESLAASGMRFTNAYAQAVCSPTRASLMTGLSATHHGQTSHIRKDGGREGANSPRDYNMSGFTTPDLECLPRWLSGAGYHTIHCGKGHFTWEHDPLALDPVEIPTFIGFDVNIGGSAYGQPGSFLGTANYARPGFASLGIPGVEAYHGTNTFLTEALTIEATKALDGAVDRGQPFFLYMSHYAVHSPFTTDPRATGDYSALNSGSSARKFATMVEGMDLAVGELLDHVKNSLPTGIAENTLVVFLGDNGSDNPLTSVNALPAAPYNDFPLRGKKGTRSEGGTRVPLIVSWLKPEAANPFQTALPIPADSHEDDIVACWDLPVTLMNVAGVPIPVPVQGHDLSDYLRQTPGVHRPQEILLYYPHGRNGDYLANFRQGDWKLSYSFQNDTFRLYNLATDPTESSNLAASDPGRTLAMARGMARQFEEEWGALGPLWPHFSSADLPLSTGSIMGGLDLDGDGRVDSLEDANANGLIDPGETDPDDSDTDNDGTDDQSEIRLGLDPLQSTSFFRAMIGPAPASGFELSWPSQPGLTFTIYHSAELSPPLSSWTTLTGVSASASGSETSWTYDGSGSRRFFVIELD